VGEDSTSKLLDKALRQVEVIYSYIHGVYIYYAYSLYIYRYIYIYIYTYIYISHHAIYIYIYIYIHIDITSRYIYIYIHIYIYISRITLTAPVRTVRGVKSMCSFLFSFSFLFFCLFEGYSGGVEGLCSLGRS
jgi:hypothetical protein